MGNSSVWNSSILLYRPFLWLLFWVNLLGTIYGYIWYESQLIYTSEKFDTWLLVFVPDSPTASLFFTLALLYLLFPPKSASVLVTGGRVIIEALAVVCSVKYGIWAVAMIVAGAWQGDQLEWTHYMLMASHLGMAIEALLYFRYMRAGLIALLIGIGWLLLNDTIDYSYGVFPWLADELEDDLTAVRAFTYGLSICSFIAALLVWHFRKKV